MIAEVQLTFSESVGQSEVESLLKDVTENGTLGQFKVDQPRVEFAAVSGKLQLFEKSFSS